MTSNELPSDADMIAKLYPSSKPQADVEAEQAFDADVERTLQKIEADDAIAKGKAEAAQAKQKPAQQPQQQADDVEDEDDTEQADDDKAGDRDQGERFTAPEGGEQFDPEVMQAFGDVVNELKLTTKEAQTLIDKVAPVMRARQLQQVQALSESWRKQAQADRYLNSGAGIEANVEAAAAVVRTHGDGELNKLLKDTGMGNHPALVRFAARVARALSDAKSRQAPARVRVKGAGGEPKPVDLSDSEELARRLYGKPVKRGPQRG